MGLFNWKHTAGDLADWLDEQDEKYWQDHDDWLMQSQRLSQTYPVCVFAAWFNDRLSTLPERVEHSVTGGIVDVLRLGNDLDFSSGWGIAKGTFLNVTRLATVLGPVSEALGIGGRYAGILATSKLKYIKDAEGPCAFVGVNNILSLFRGQPVQLFATVEDIVAVRGANQGIGRAALLADPKVQAALAKYGITFEKLGGMQSIADVLRAAKAADGPITFGIQWPMDGKMAVHGLTAVKDATGVLRLLDYVEEGGTGVFKGFSSLEEMMKARPGWGPGFTKVTLIKQNPVFAFSSRYLKLLKFADGSSSFGIPVAMGMKWAHGAAPDDKVSDMVRSVWRFIKARKPDLTPPPPAPSVPPQIPQTVTSIPSVPDHNGKGLGVSPLPPEAGHAPRIDWLTGVQYRLKYLGYYRGPVHGKDDQPTKHAVLAFQKDWFDDAKQWDSIPGPITQAALYAAVGW